MKWGALILGLLSALAVVIFVRSLLLAPKTASIRGQNFETGTAVLDAYRCRPGEWKRILTRGIEDDYSPLGDEPARSERINLSVSGRNRQANYDGREENRELFDYFDLPRPVTSGLFMIRLHAIGEVTSDSLKLGDFSALPVGADVYEKRFVDLTGDPVWKSEGDLRWALIQDMRFASGVTISTFLKSHHLLDVSVADDLSVDFIGLAVCEPPAQRAGVTFHPVSSHVDARRSIVAFWCYGNDIGEPDCNPWSGDQPCDRELPLLCLADRNLKAPNDAQTDNWRRRFWSGGEVAASPPARGDRFETIAEADRDCASLFGPEWRVADFHAGGGGWGFAARGDGREFSGQYWIDIRDQPYGTCWGRRE